VFRGKQKRNPPWRSKKHPGQWSQVQKCASFQDWELRHRHLHSSWAQMWPSAGKGGGHFFVERKKKEKRKKYQGDGPADLGSPVLVDHSTRIRGHIGGLLLVLLLEKNKSITTTHNHQSKRTYKIRVAQVRPLSKSEFHCLHHPNSWECQSKNEIDRNQHKQ